MALGNNNTSAGLGNLPWKKMLDNITPSWLKPNKSPLSPTPNWTVPYGTTRFLGYEIGPNSAACAEWLEELTAAQTALQTHDGMIADVVTALTNTLLSDRDECVKEYKDYIPPFSTVGFMVCQHNAMDKFNKAVAELQERNQATRDQLLLRVTKAKEALDFWCNQNGWPPGGQPLPNQQFYPVPPPDPGLVGRRWGGIGME